MSNNRFRDYSAGMKVLMVIEFFVLTGSFLLAMQLERRFRWTDVPVAATNTLVIYAILFALTALLRGDVELTDLVFMCEKLAVARRVRVESVALLIRSDVRADQEELAITNRHISFSETEMTLTD